MTRRKPLTMRLLDAMLTACAQLEAGSPEELEGYEGDEAQEMYSAITDATAWLSAEIGRRKTAKESSPSSSDSHGNEAKEKG